MQRNRNRRRPIYLDYAATTPVDPRVARCMMRFLTAAGQFANPSSTSHIGGHAARAAVETARARVAALINAEPREIVFTSGATESNNIALQGALRGHRRSGGQVVTGKTEHKAVLDVCRALERDGFKVTYLDPGVDGRITPASVAAAVRPDTVLVSLMHVNNELGVVQDIAAVGRLTRELGILLHVDAAQSAGKIGLDCQAQQLDLVSLSAHKMYGPKGIGALYVRRRPKVRLAALMHGGGHEQGLRPGTLATHQIAGFGEAARIARLERGADNQRIRGLQQRLWTSLRQLGGVSVNGTGANVGGILNLSFAGVHAEALLAELWPSLAVATGSACSSASDQPSHVLQALGVDPLLAASALRISIGRFTTAAEIDQAAALLGAAVERLRSLSPLQPA